jgi:hypothetical protein
MNNTYFYSGFQDRRWYRQELHQKAIARAVSKSPHTKSGRTPGSACCFLPGFLFNLRLKHILKWRDDKGAGHDF